MDTCWDLPVSEAYLWSVPAYVALQLAAHDIYGTYWSGLTLSFRQAKHCQPTSRREPSKAQHAEHVHLLALDTIYSSYKY